MRYTLAEIKNGTGFDRDVQFEEVKGYNGWKNYETWVMALWIDNEEGSYHYSRELVAEAAREAREDNPGGRTAAGLAADALRNWMEDASPDLPASVWSDLLRAAFSEVDWYEIAEHYLEETS